MKTETTFTLDELIRRARACGREGIREMQFVRSFERGNQVLASKAWYKANRALAVAPSNAQLIVYQAYRIGASLTGHSQWKIAFLCPVRGIVEIYRSIPVVADEFEQAALVREAIHQFRNS